MRVNISIDDKLLEDFDKHCDKFRYTRSELLSKIMRDVVYGKPVAIVNTLEKSVNTTSTMPVEIEHQKSVVGENPIMGWCQLHFEKGKNYPIREITWEDENGTPIVEKKWACPKCIEKYQNMGRGKLHFL